MKLSEAQRVSLLRHYDRTFGGDEIISADRRSTLSALQTRGLCKELMPPMRGGYWCWTAMLTPEGRKLREKLEQ